MRRNLQAVSFRLLHCLMSNWADPIEDPLIGASLTRAFSVRLEQGSPALVNPVANQPPAALNQCSSFPRNYCQRLGLWCRRRKLNFLLQQPCLSFPHLALLCEFASNTRLFYTPVNLPGAGFSYIFFLPAHFDWNSLHPPRAWIRSASVVIPSPQTTPLYPRVRDLRQQPARFRASCSALCRGYAHHRGPAHTVKLASTPTPYPDLSSHPALTPPPDAEPVKMEDGPQILPLPVPTAIEAEPISRPSSTSTQGSAPQAIPQTIPQGLPSISSIAPGSQATSSPQTRSVRPRSQTHCAGACAGGRPRSRPGIAPSARVLARIGAIGADGCTMLVTLLLVYSLIYILPR